MNREQMIAWLTLEGWESAVGPNKLRGLCHPDHPGKIMCVSFSSRCRSSQAIFYLTPDVRKEAHEFSSDHIKLFMHMADKLRGQMP